MRLRQAALVITLGFAILAGEVASAAAQQPREQPTRSQGPLVVVFDGSGSMWGEIDGTRKNKLTVAREAIAAAVRAENPGLSVGLVTFGARQGGSCRSVEVPVQPAAGSVDAVEQVLERFNPQGRGPIVAGLDAARDLLEGDSGGRVLLVHDSDDNCGGDACAFATALARTRPGLSIDVLSLALKAADRPKVQCLAKATGGRWIEAENADELAAGARTLIAAFSPRGAAVAATPRGGGIARNAARAATASPDAAPAAAGAGNLMLSAVLAGTGVALPGGVRWRVKALAESGDDAFERSFERPSVVADVQPGRYEVVLEARGARETRTVAVAAGEPQQVRIEVAGGFLDVKASAAAGKLTPVATVEALGTGSGSPPNVVWTGPLTDAHGFILTAGRYRVSLADGLQRAAETISLKAGEARALALDFSRARLEVSVEGLDQDQRAAAIVEIAADDPTAPDGRRLVTRTAAEQATFSLAPGTYHVTLDVFGTRQTELVVLPQGETGKAHLRVQQMALSVTTLIAETDRVVDAGVRYQLWRADDLTRPIRVVHDGRPVFYLAPGRYRIESRIGQQNALIVREFHIGQQRQGKLKLRHDAGTVTFRLPGGEEIADNNAYWELRDQNARLIWRTFAASPTMTLKAGVYDVRVASAQEVYRGKFAVVAGHAQTLTLGRE